MTTSISPVITNALSTSPILIASSPHRAHSSSPISASSVNATIPLSMLSNSTSAINHAAVATNHTTKIFNIADQQQLTTLSPTLTTQSNAIKKTLPNGLNVNLNGITPAHNQLSINLSSMDGISPALLSATNAAMPLNLNINAVHHQQIGSNGVVTSAAVTSSSVPSNGIQIISTGTTNGKNGIRQTFDLSDQHHSSIISNGKISKESKMDSEPPTKVIKLIKANTIALASMDKDHKLISSGQLTLSQVMVSQIPLLTSSQALRVIGQTPNGLATIELSNSNGNFTKHLSISTHIYLNFN